MALSILSAWAMECWWQIRAIHCLLMAWLLRSPRHQQTQYCLPRAFYQHSLFQYRRIRRYEWQHNVGFFFQNMIKHNILRKLGPYHACWYPGSSHRQDISRHDIDCMILVNPSKHFTLLRVWICTLSFQECEFNNDDNEIIIIIITSDDPCWNGGGGGGGGGVTKLKKINKEIKARSVLGGPLCCNEFSIPLC